MRTVRLPFCFLSALSWLFREQVEFAVTFSERGYMLFNYQTNWGEVRTVELDQPLQFQYVPPGGGVRTMRVESVDQRSAAISYVFSSSFERSRGGYLEQNYTSEEHEYSLVSGGLSSRVVSRAASYLGDRSGPVGGPGNAEVFEGVLKKIE
jgi:hypothetical protein